MNNNEIYLKLKSIFDRGNIEYCPKCNEITNVISNSMYYWKCDNCDYECDYRNLPIKSVKEQVIDILNKINIIKTI